MTALVLLVGVQELLQWYSVRLGRALCSRGAHWERYAPPWQPSRPLHHGQQTGYSHLLQSPHLVRIIAGSQWFASW